MKVLVCGGRKYGDSETFHNAMQDAQESYGVITMVIEGGAEGADRLASEWAESHGVHAACVKPLWKRHGKSAGPKRNAAMLLLDPDLVLAFPGGAGTADMVKRAERAGVSVIRVNAGETGEAR